MVINELLDVLFWRNVKSYVECYKGLTTKYYPHDNDEFNKQFNKYILDYVQTKENFTKLIEDYNINGKPVWQGQNSQYCDLLNQDDICNALANGTYEIGERRYGQYEKAINSWAYHLHDYTNSVNYTDGQRILELSTGAGLGTCSVMKTLLPNNRLISIDIDFAAARNADGLAQFLGMSDRVCGLNANFWYIPFENDTLDVVCTHYGLDESGEIEIVINEVSRVLRHSGRFVVIARKNPYDRHKRYMGLFNISEAECNPLLKKARLYSGLDDLIETAQKYKLFLTENKLYERDSSHHRILYVFNKK